MNGTKPHTNGLRGLAAVTLAFWVVAQFFCTLHCTSGKASLTSIAAAKSCCHKAAQPADATPASDSSAPSNCFAFKLPAPTAATPHDFSAPEDIQPITALDLTEILSVLSLECSSSDRPATRPYRVIAHEVSLGSDARAHAPPFFA